MNKKKCTSCGDTHSGKGDRVFPSAVIEINNPPEISVLRKVVIPTSMGDDTDVVPAIGKYRNVILQYEANGHIYLYSSDGIPTFVESGIPQEILDRIASLEGDVSDVETDINLLKADLATETNARELADATLQQEIDDFKNSPDVVDIVATYAALEAYDTQHLGNNDVIRVLRDETHDGQSSYYRWDKPNSTWVFIGTVGDYYTKGQVDTLLEGKQDTLTAGDNITISNNTISATDTTYSDFTGTDGTTAGTHGLVPAPATTDAGKFLKADGTWDTAGGSAVNVVQTTGTSTTDVMSQNATTSMVYNDPAAKEQVRIGKSAVSSGASSIAVGDSSRASAIYTTAIGAGAYAAAGRGVAVGPSANARYIGSIAMGADSITNSVGEMNIGTTTTNYGYNSSNYRLLTGLYDAQSDHDAVNLSQLNGRVKTNAGAPTTSTAGTVGQLYEDTTNGKLYICTDATNPYVWTEVGSGEVFYVDITPTNVGTSTVTTTANKTNTEIHTAYSAGKIVIARITISQSMGAFAAGTYLIMPLWANSVAYLASGTSYDPQNNTTTNFAYMQIGQDGTNTSGTIYLNNVGNANITMTTTDPGEGSALAENNYVAVYGGDPIIMDYSTSEINTGTYWIDGSAIYKKTINFGNLPNASTKSVAHNIANLDMVIKMEAMAKGSATNFRPLPMVGTVLADMVRLDIQEGNVRAIDSSDYSAYSAYITLYYTKSS